MQSNVFICGTVRNCEPHLDNVFKNIQKIVEQFADFRIIMSYDKSDDKSLLKLTKQKAEYKTKMDIIINSDELYNVRTMNIAKARNSCLHKIHEHIINGFSAEYFIMIDMDDVCGGYMDIDVFKRAMDKSDQWDSVSFYRHGYYDIWALSIDKYIYSCWGWYNPMNAVEAMRAYVIDKLINTPSDKLVECRSAFNGFAVYKTDKFINCVYDWRIPLKYMSLEDLFENQRLLGYPYSISPLDIQTNEPDCEHRSFHMMATHKNGARIRISPERMFWND